MLDETALPPGYEVLLVEDDAVLRRRLAAYLGTLKAVVSEAPDLARARSHLAANRFDFVLMDLHLPDGEALALFREGVFSENTAVVVMTAFGGVKKAVEAIRLGAADYLAKPFEPEELSLVFLNCRRTRTAARREEHRANAADSAVDAFFFGTALAPLRAQLETVLAAERRLSRRLPPVLTEGETGTGKSLVARWLHRAGPRAERPLVSLNCAALPDTLADAELFGHERGAFTDVKQARIGLFEAADGGTLFLDEIASLSAATQAKILTAIEDGVIRRLGGTKEIPVDVRLIAASNRPLAGLVATGAFREDLYHRLDLIRVTLPPLRERAADLLPLARHLLGRIAARHRLVVPTITPTGEARLLAQPWRGNVRELAHELERAVIFDAGRPLDFGRLGGAADSAPLPLAGWRNPSRQLPAEGFALDTLIDELIAHALAATDQNVSAAARRLGVTREFLRYRLNGGRASSPPPALS